MSVSDKQLAYLGRSIKWPITLINGTPQYVEGIALVEQSLKMLFDTSLNSTFMLREFGTRLKESVFDINDPYTQDLLRVFIIEAAEEWETRVTVVGVEFGYVDDTTTNILVNFDLLNKPGTNTFIYPYYSSLVA